MAVWLLPYRPDCDTLAWDNDPAIARVGDECIRHSAYLERLRLLERAIVYAERGLPSEAPNSDQWQLRHVLAISFGPDTAAVADLFNASALYQHAIATGHTPTDSEVYDRRDADRLRSDGYAEYIELAKLAQKDDLVGVRELLERTENANLLGILDQMSPSEFIASLQEDEWRQLELSLEEGEAYLEAVDRERFWSEIYPERLRGEMSLAILEETVLNASADGPYADVPRLAWLDYQEDVLENADIQLTGAAPPTLLIEHALAYLAAVRELERQVLNEEYRRFQQRRQTNQ